MPILNPDHLIDQADRLIFSPHAGPPRQVDLRRAVSSAYYALFHLTSTALADEFVGASYRNSNRYALVYRSVDHRGIKELCLRVSKRSPLAKYVPYVPPGGFGRELVTYADTFVTLQDERHLADYDIALRFQTLRAQLAVATSRSGLVAFRAAETAERRVFLTLLLCPPR